MNQRNSYSKNVASQEPRNGPLIEKLDVTQTAVKEIVHHCIFTVNLTFSMLSWVSWRRYISCST